MENINTYLKDEPTDVIKCSRIVAYNTTGDLVMWMLYDLNGKRLYSSSVLDNHETLTINLGTLGFTIGKQFMIACRTSSISNNVYADEILTYTPDSNATAYYQIDIASHKLQLTYNGVVPPFYTPNANPYLKSSGIIIKNSSATLTKYGLYTLDGVKLYESDRFSEGETFKLNFKNTSIEPYATFRVKALVVAGSDDTCDVILQYAPESYYVGAFQLFGTTINNTLVFKGSYSLIPDSSKIVNGEQVMAYNNSNMTAKFDIILLDGTKIYESGKTTQWEKVLINLKDLGIVPNTYVRVKVVLTANDLKSDMVIKYEPNSGCAYFKLSGNAGIPNSHELNYYGVLSTETTPPLLKCSSISGLNDSNMITKWSFISNDQTIYTSGRCRINKTWTLDLINSVIKPGTRFLLKSNAIAGEDATAYVTIEYDPDTNVRAHFQFAGIVYKTILIYEGI